MSKLIIDKVCIGSKSSANLVIDHLEVPTGKIIGIVGAKDVGKTEFINMLDGRTKITSGTIMLDGKPFKPFKNEKIIVVSDKFYLPQFSTVENLIENFADYYPNFNKDLAMKYLVEYDIPLNVKYRRFERIVQITINVILAIACRAEVTIFDQPAKNYAVNFRKNLYKKIFEDYNIFPRTVFIASNVAIDVDEIVQEVIYIRARQILFHLPYNEVANFAIGLNGDKKIIETILENKELFYKKAQENGNLQVIVKNDLPAVKRQQLAKNNVITQYVNLVNLHGYIVKQDYQLEDIVQKEKLDGKNRRYKAKNRNAQKLNLTGNNTSAKKCKIVKSSKPLKKSKSSKPKPIKEKKESIWTRDLFAKK